MFSGISKSAAAAAAACLVLASSANAGVLVDGYQFPGATAGLGFLQGSDLSSTGTTIPLVDPAVGLAYGAGSLYVSTLGSPSNNLTRYNLAGDQIGQVQFGPLFEAGPLAFGGNAVFAGYSGQTLGGDVFGVSMLTVGLDFTSFDIELASAPKGLAYGDGSLFVSYDSTLARYDLLGNLLGSYDYGTVDLGALAFGGGELYVAFTGSGGSQGIRSVDPTSFLSAGFSVDTAGPVNGLAFGDGALFASFQSEVVKYGVDGAQAGSVNTFGLVNGPLAYIAQPTRPDDPCEPGTLVCGPGSAAPEPSAWALMILGFGAAGATLRRRRQHNAVAR